MKETARHASPIRSDYLTYTRRLLDNDDHGVLKTATSILEGLPRRRRLIPFIGEAAYQRSVINKAEQRLARRAAWWDELAAGATR